MTQLELEAPEEKLKLETFDVEASRMPLPIQLSFQEGRLPKLNKQFAEASEEDKPEIKEDIDFTVDAIAKLKDRILGNVAVNVE